MRKRVTLMVVSVSSIFAVCWLTDSISYVVSFYTAAHTFNDVTYVATSIMIMLNAAINPIIYALVSKQFRDKMKAWSPFDRRRQRIADRRSQITQSSAIVWSRTEKHCSVIVSDPATLTEVNGSMFCDRPSVLINCNRAITWKPKRMMCRDSRLTGNKIHPDGEHFPEKVSGFLER